ncbi:MAG: PAS domain S-box protein, partial [Methanobacterium sp.]
SNPIEFIHPDDREKVKNDLKDVYKEKNSGSPTEFRILKADGTYLPVESIAQNLIDIPGINGIVINTHPIKDRKKLEDHLIKTNRSLRMLSDCNKSLIRAKDEKELLKEICGIIIEKCDYTFTWVGFPDENEKILHPVAFAGKEGGYLESIHVSWDDGKYGKGPSGNAYRNRKEFIINDLSLDKNFAPWRDEALKRDYASVISLPLFSKENIIGIISIYSSQKDRFDDEEVVLLQELANDLAYGIISIRSDIERKRVENKLEQSEQKYHTLFDNAGDGILIMNRDRFIDCNSKALEIYGVTKKELIGETPYDLFSPEYQPDRELSEEKALKYINNALKGYQQLFEWKHKRLDESLVYSEVNLNRLKIGSKYYLMAIVRDITERKKVEKALQKSRTRLKIAMDMAKLVHWEYDVESDMFTFDDQFYALYGMNIEKECITQMSSEEYAKKFLPPEESSLVAAEIAKSLETDDPNYSCHVDHSIIRADGKKRFITVRIAVIKDNKGHTIKIYGANQDITERKKSENEIHRLADVVKSSDDSIITKSLDGIITSWNKGAENTYGYPAEEILGKSVSILEPPQLSGETKKLIEKIKQGEKINHYETLRLKKDGT